jgi:hypothetical protein
MIADILQKEFVLEALDQVRNDLGGVAQSPGRRRSGPDELPAEFAHLTPADFEAAQAALEAALEREHAASSGQEGFDSAPQEGGRRGESESKPLDSTVFLSRDPDISALQSALDEFLEVQAPERIARDVQTSSTRRNAGSDADAQSDIVMVTDKSLATKRRVFEQFSVTDIRWISCLFAEAKRKFSQRHEFVSAPTSHDLHAKSRLLVVGDWASGLPRAIYVSQWIRHHLELGLTENIAQHVIHLGDTYYSGWPSEYERRFLPHWPVHTALSERIGSWSLNANHDMYSGGYGYYDTLLRDTRFARHGSCSYFALQTPFWRILGIDTGWKDGELEEPQATWVRQQCTEARIHNQKVLLLSHHQLFSSYESEGTALQSSLRELLNEGHIHAWIWGHEHRCMVFGPHLGLQYAACVGHGGVPVYMNHAEKERCPEPGIYEDRRYMQQGLERWAYMGFCILDFEDRNLGIRFLDENGDLIRTDRIGS